MNETTSLHLEDDNRFDRLVDGELNDEEYRQFLSTLDDRPDGWRRCAMAFLEAQSWSNEFKGVFNETDQRSAHRSVSAISKAPNKLGTFLAMAACFLVALFLGMYLRSGSLTVQTAPTNNSLVVENGTQDDEAPDDQQAPIEDTVVASDETKANEPLGNVRFVLNEGENENRRFIDVPYYELEQMASEQYSDSMWAIPPDVIQELNQKGHQVRRDQQFIPVDLQNGRRVVIPIDQFEIVPVGGLYQ